MSHYFSNDDVSSNLFSFQTKILNNNYTFFSDNGVFSKNSIDFGSKFLLETLPLKDMSGDILDVGCGYGTIGIVTAKETNSNVDMIDVNKRSVHLSDKNISVNKLNNANAFLSNCYENVNKEYDYIITNPPIRAGKKIIYEILFGAKERLKDTGELWFVIRKDQGAKSVIADMQKEYNIDVVDKKKGFFVIRATFS